LPGAACTVRLDAIEGEPSDAMFKTVDNDEPPCDMANEYLAEDRAMLLYMLINKGKNYHLGYLPEAIFYTDPPEDLKMLIK